MVVAVLWGSERRVTVTMAFGDLSGPCHPIVQAAEEVVHIDVQGASELPQSHCRNPVLAALVFLNLLQPHATGQADGRLRQT
jgi:hypothetical protein